MTTNDPIYSKNNVPNEDMDWGNFHKKVTTKAMRIDGPFSVETSEGTLRCNDGWLCIDARGYPYPVADDEFQLIYEEVTE